jgi:hypothetical protein
MAALFYNFGSDNIFKNSVGSGALMFSDDFDEFSASSSNLSIVTDIKVSVNETVQFFQSFDDFIHYYYFGKGLGSVTVDFLFFQSCDSNDAPGVSKLLAKIGQKRGQIINISIANVVFSGVLMDVNIAVTAEPETMYAISINIGMTDHQLPSANLDNPSC